MNKVEDFLPQRPPFLFIDRIVEKSEKQIHCQKILTGKEDFFKGHFPDFPVMPGVLLLESMFQAGAILMSSGTTTEQVGVVTRVNEVKFKNLVRPGDTLDIRVELTETMAGAFWMKGNIRVHEKIVASAQFACALVAKPMAITPQTNAEEFDFLSVKDKTFFITGIANKKSIAYHVADLLQRAGAKLVLSVQHETMLKKIQELFPNAPILLLDVNEEEHFLRVQNFLREKNLKLDGFLHSLAFANLNAETGIPPFHETKTKDFMEAINISALSLVKLSHCLQDFLHVDASAVTVSISSTKATSYGYLGPVKAMLDAMIPFLAKSFAQNEKTKFVRFNSVAAGPLKTAASAGIPGYLENYLYSEKLMLRKKALKTEEVANTIVYLLSPRSSGINAEKIVIDGGMSANYFDQDIVSATMKNYF